MNEMRRPWTAPALAVLAIAVLAFGMADVGGVIPRAPIEPVAGEPRAARVMQPAHAEMIDDVQPARPRPAASEPSLSRAPTPRPEPSLRPKPRSTPKVAHRRPARPVQTPMPTPMPTPVQTPMPTPVPVPPAPALPPAATPPPPPPPPPLPQPVPAPAPVATVPAGILDLGHWKLTLPVGRKGRPTEIRQPDLATFQDGRYFALDPSGSGVIFRANAGGVTTENSGYPRSELREMAASTEAAWSSRRGTHVMTVTQAVTATPRRKPHVVAAQIHDGNDDVMAIRLEGRRLFVDAGGRAAGVLDPHYVLGAQYTVEITASAAGIRVTYHGTPQAGGAPARVVTLQPTGRGWYFKVGCYTQSNPSTGDDPTAYGEVIVYRLAVRHTA